ncbi:MAG TPA: tetratricopeptide repeat protein [Kofleriaceae bacterium]|nr:tetratricopeptide repeat protein [Kofleriaceae bacterium]
MPVRILALLALLFAVTPRVAHADDPATRAAKRHFDRGEKLFALGKFDDALDEYQKAFDAKPIPDFLFNIGQCYRNLGDYQQAIFSFKKYLKLEPDAPDKDKVEKLIDDLEEKQERGEGQRLVGKKEPPPPLPPPPASTPIYKKWWFWTGIAVVGAGTGVGVYEATKGGAPGTSLGNITFTK